jgi:hypothetical protein
VTVYIPVPNGKKTEDIVVTYAGIQGYNPCETDTTNPRVNWVFSQTVQHFGLTRILEDPAGEFDPAFVLPSGFEATHPQLVCQEPDGNKPSLVPTPPRRAIQRNGEAPVLHRVNSSRSLLERFVAHITLPRLHMS